MRVKIAAAMTALLVCIPTFVIAQGGSAGQKSGWANTNTAKIGGKVVTVNYDQSPSKILPTLLDQSGRTWKSLGDGVLTTEATLEFSNTKCTVPAGTYRILPFHLGEQRRLIINKAIARTAKYDEAQDLCRLDFEGNGQAVKPVWISPFAQPMQPQSLADLLALGWLRIEAEDNITLTGLMIHIVK